MNLFTTYGLDIEENLSLSHKYQGEWSNYKIASIHLSGLIRFTEARASIVGLLKQSLNSRDESKPSLIETVYIENQGDNIWDKTSLYQKARNRFSKIVQSHNYRELSYEEGETSYFDSGWDQMVNTPAIFIYGIPNKGASVLTEDEKSLVEDIKRIDRELKGICSNFTKLE